MRLKNTALCVCGKLCTSKPGLTLHQRNCAQAKVYLNKGEPAVQKLKNVIEPEIRYTSQVQNLMELVRVAAQDAHVAITEGNKSAGRRSRIALLKLKQMIIPLRKLILEKISR